MNEIIALLHPYLVIITGLVILFLGLWTLFAASKEASKWSFAATTASIAGYLICFGLLSFIHEKPYAMLVSRIGEASAHQISPMFFSFSIYFLNLEWGKRLTKILPFMTFFLITLMVFSLPGKYLDFHWWGVFLENPWHLAKLRFTFYFLYFFGFMAWSLINFIRALKSESNPNRVRQIKLILFSFGIAYIGALDHLTWVGVSIYPFGYIPLLIFAILMTYAIVRHQLMDINLLIKKLSLILLIYTLLFAILIPVFFFLSRNLDLTQLSNPTLTLISLSLLFGFILSAGPILYATLVRNSFWLKSRSSVGLTHELKSPLGAIRGALEVIKSKGQEASDPDPSYLGIIDRNTTRLENYVQNLLALTDEKGGDVVLSKEKLNLSYMVDNLIQNYQFQCKEKGLSLEHTTSETDVFVQGDPEKLKQALSNLISNAIKFSANSKIFLNVSRRNDHVVFQIKDQGQGIHPKHLSKVFDRFYQGSSSAKGSGIGLTIAKNWVEAHGGKIWAESEGEGKGCTIAFTLPIS